MTGLTDPERAIWEAIRSTLIRVGSADGRAIDLDSVTEDGQQVVARSAMIAGLRAHDDLQAALHWYVKEMERRFGAIVLEHETFGPHADFAKLLISYRVKP